MHCQRFRTLTDFLSRRTVVFSDKERACDEHPSLPLAFSFSSAREFWRQHCRFSLLSSGGRKGMQERGWSIHLLISPLCFLCFSTHTWPLLRPSTGPKLQQHRLVAPESNIHQYMCRPLWLADWILHLAAPPGHRRQGPFTGSHWRKPTWPRSSASGMAAEEGM